MKLQISRESLLEPLQAVIGVVERRQTMPILANLLIEAEDGRLRMTGTDLEVEIRAEISCPVEETGSVTVPARKFMDICRTLPDGAALSLELNDAKLQVRSGRSRFVLMTLPAIDYPIVEDLAVETVLKVPADILASIFERTHFSMAQQDVRYYLNGLLLEATKGRLRAVATDGHRLAMSDAEVDLGDIEQQVIVPRKAVLELQRMLGDADGDVEIGLAGNHIRASIEGITLTSKLIDGKFPDYQRVLPAPSEHLVNGETAVIKQALVRASILSSDKYRGVRVQMTENQINIQANNPEQESAEEEIVVEYTGPTIEIGFNSGYLLDALNALRSPDFVISVTDSSSSCLVREKDNDSSVYVVMPMRL